jgi:NADP-dependent 3-hydroxy acid dehydrogenase YdfG
LAHIEIGAIN